MKKSLLYYLSQIKEAYPEITDIKKGEFEKISAEINAQIQADKPVTAHKKLFDKTYRFLKILANLYAENGIDYKSFNDNMSALQLKIMDKLNNKVERKEWFLNFTSYVSALSHYSTSFMNNFQKDNTSQKEFKAKLVDSLLNDEVIKQVYEKELKSVEDRELRTILLETLDTLMPREEKMIRYYYGIDDDHQRTLVAAGQEFNISRDRVIQILDKALRKLRHPSRSRKIKDFYKLT